LLFSYNILPHPEEQAEVTDSTLKALGELFVRHRVRDIFGIHLLHSHFAVPEGTALLGIRFQVSEASQACWTKPVSVEELATKSIHGHVFRLQSDRTFVPYEFQEGGAASEAAGTEPAFFHELADFLHRNNLANLVALQLSDDTRDNTNMELLIGSQSTLGLAHPEVLLAGLSRWRMMGLYLARAMMSMPLRKTPTKSFRTRSLLLRLRL
jgi:hypothetical protein